MSSTCTCVFSRQCKSTKLIPWNDHLSGIVLNRKRISTKKEVLLVLMGLRKTPEREREREEKRARDSEDERERDDDNNPIYYMKR